MKKLRIFLPILAIVFTIGLSAFNDKTSLKTDKPDPSVLADKEKSLKAFSTILTVLKSPRCINCHPTADIPRHVMHNARILLAWEGALPISEVRFKNVELVTILKTMFIPMSLVHRIGVLPPKRWGGLGFQITKLPSGFWIKRKTAGVRLKIWSSTWVVIRWFYGLGIRVKDAVNHPLNWKNGALF